MKMQIKPGVRLIGLRPETCLAVTTAYSVFAHHDHDCVITSVTDGQHSYGSLHYAGCAFDLRSRHLNAETAQKVLADLKECLGQDFDVVLESDHFHVEYQPKEAYK